MKFSVRSLIVGLLCGSVAALNATDVNALLRLDGGGGGGGAAADASGAADAQQTNTKAQDVQNKLEKEVGEMVLQSTEKVKSLKGMLTTNGKAIAALTGLFKEVSRLTSAIGEYEGQLRACKTELAVVKTQQQAGPENEAYFNSASSDPLAGMFFLQEKAQTALAHASHVFSTMQKSPHGVSLLQSGHHRHRRSDSEEESTDEDSTESDSDAESGSVAMAFGLNTIGEGEEDMDSRVRNVKTANSVLPGMDPLQYGMYDFTGSHGVKIFDHASLDPDVQRKRELEAVNMMTRQGHFNSGQDNSEDDEDD